MKMTANQYSFCIKEVVRYSDKDAFISDLVLSDIWKNEASLDVPNDELAEWLSQFWEACNRSVKEIAKAVNLSQRKLAERFYISYRTMEGWGAKRHECTLYLRLMMQECLGLLKVEIE